jgi:hypothetical protein
MIGCAGLPRAGETCSAKRAKPRRVRVRGSMRSVWFGVCCAALLCGSCGGGSAPRVEAISAYGEPAGYYAGRGGDFAITPELTAWLAKNQAGIDEIQQRIIDIREGKRTPGCIGEDKYTCVATLAQKLVIADDYALKDFNLFAETKYDVNGRPLTGSKIMFDGYAPGAQGYLVHNQTTFLLTLARNGTVASVEANLPKDPTFARTQDEYDATGAYETVSAVTANTCPTLSRAAVAKWIENTIKPNSRFGPKEHWENQGWVSAIDRFSKKATLCGRTFQFHSIWGTRRVGFKREDFGGMTIQIQ